MTEITESQIKELNEAHDEIIGSVRASIEMAIQLGGNLTTAKEATPHGEWQAWMAENLKFSASTAKRYMACWEARKTLKKENIEGLKEAYALLSNPTKDSAQDSKRSPVTVSSTKTAPEKGEKQTEPDEPETKPSISNVPVKKRPAEAGKPIHLLAIWTEIEGLYGKALNRLDELNRFCCNPASHALLISGTKKVMGDLSKWRESVKKA